MRRLLLLLCLSWGVHAAGPRVGAPFPLQAGHDVSGQLRRLDTYRGQKLLVVLMTHPKARHQVVSWLSWAKETRPNLSSLMVVSLRLPFFVGSETVRRRIKAQVPQDKWPHTWFERDAVTTESLGLSQSSLPWVFALDEDGRVLAATQEPFSEEEAQKLFSVFALGEESTKSPVPH